MNQDQILGYFRTLCTMAGSILGYSAVQTDKLTSAMMGLGAFVFFAISVYGTWKANSEKSKIASVAANENVAGVQMKQTAAGVALVQALDHPKVAA